MIPRMLRVFSNICLAALCFSVVVFTHRCSTRLKLINQRCRFPIAVQSHSHYRRASGDPLRYRRGVDVASACIYQIIYLHTSRRPRHRTRGPRPVPDSAHPSFTRHEVQFYVVRSVLVGLTLGEVVA